MKKHRVKMGILISLLSIIAVLEIFDLHPSISVGNTSIIWSGFRRMHVLYTHGEFTVGVGSIRGENGKYYHKRYDHFLGPVTICRYEQPVA
jgi:hypothetical protein